MIGNFHFVNKSILKGVDWFSPLSIAIIIDAETDCWPTYVAQLTQDEQLLLKSQKTPAARNSFCLGKIAAKTAVKCLLDREIEFTIDHGIFGFPIVEPNHFGINISLAHTKHTGIAVCTSQKYPVGIDIEELSSSNNQIIMSTLTKVELGLSNHNNLTETVFLHILWTAREALSKVIRTGFLVPMSLLSIKSVTPISKHFKIEFVNFSLFTGLVFCIGNHSVCVVIPTMVSLDIAFIDDILKAFDVAKCNHIT
jgi:4'-phosphopantetheinyl transferase